MENMEKGMSNFEGVSGRVVPGSVGPVEKQYAIRSTQ